MTTQTIIMGALLLGVVSGSVSVFGGGITPVCFDSGTRVVREVATALTGHGKSILECYPPGSEIFSWFLHFFPPQVRIAGMEWGMSISLGSSPRALDRFTVASLPEWCISQYPTRRYDAILIGAPNGGAAHLAALLHAPFLTSSFDLVFHHRSIDPDDIDTYAAIGTQLANKILAAPGADEIEVIDHYDPIHDRALVKYANFLRVKLVTLPAAYQRFIRDNLAPGGKLILIDPDYPWPQYVVGNRSYLQVGGLGAVAPAEYLNRWRMDLPVQERPESEWGCPIEFAAAVHTFARAHGIEVIDIRLPHPQDYGLLAYHAYLAAGAQRKEIMFDCFNYQSPYTNVQTGIPALWLPFNTADSLAGVRKFLAGKTFDRIYLALVPSFARCPDTTSVKSWENLLAEHGKVMLLGIDPHAYPADTLAPFRFVRAMTKLYHDQRLPKPLHLTTAALLELMQEMGTCGK